MIESVHGRVRVSYGGHGVVATADGRQVDCKFRRSVGRPCCGDRVLIAAADVDSSVVEDILPRRNRFLRADSRGRGHIVAANLDRVLIVIAPRPLPSDDLLDRYLVAVHSLAIEPLIVHNKTDLNTLSRGPDNATLERLPEYEALGYRVIRTSCKADPGVEELLPAVSEGVSILVGQSGVGKSSLVRKLLPDLDIQIGELSRITGKGTHTTTATTLYALRGGGHLIDSPGVWEYGLWKLDAREIAVGYREFTPFLGRCKFSDCQHASEPGCAVKQAATEGLIPAWRHASYLRLLRQNETLHSR